MLNGSKLDEDFHFNLTPGKIAKFKNAKLALCGVKSSFSKYKNIL